jgi:cytochrome b subunit of formate dehydrogenase
MAFYNMSLLDGASVSIGDFFTFLNDATYNMFSLLILIAFFIIALTNLKNYPGEDAFAPAAFITSVMGVFMIALGWIDHLFVIGFIVLLALFAVIFSIKKNS